MPIAALALKVALEAVFFIRFGSLPQGQPDVLISAAQSLSIAGNPIGQLFYAIGVSSVFFLEYRFNTWRNLVPRAGRLPLLAAKISACVFCISVGLVITIVGDISLNAVLRWVRFEGSEVVSVNGSGARVLAAAFAIAILELATLATIVAAVTIVFRSMIAAVVPVFLLAFGTMFLQAFLGSGATAFPLPSIAADAIRAWLFTGVGGRAAIVGFATMTAWCLAATIVGAGVFARQPLSSE